MSNVVGTIVDIPYLVAAARAAGAHVLVDACQAVPQMPVDVSAWDADFVAFSSHKMLGPTGIGALWAKAELLEAMPPFLGGGEMIRDVTTEGFSTNDIPWKFEAGTPAIVEAVGMGAAVDYLEAIGMDAVREHERALTEYTLGALATASMTGCTSTGRRTRQTAAGRSRSSSTASTRTTCRRSSTRRVCASAPATTARSR